MTGAGPGRHRTDVPAPAAAMSPGDAALAAQPTARIDVSRVVTPPHGTPGAPAPQATATSGAPTRKRRNRWRSSHYTPEEREEAREALRKAVPWDGPMRGGDWFILLATFGVVAFNLASMPFRPLLIASYPVALAAVTGSLSAVGTGAAFARIGEAQLWLVVAAGVFGMIKFDWLFWLAGRRWGAKIVEMYAPGAAAQRTVGWVRNAPRWVMPLVVVGAALPGIPAPAVFAVAGMGRMRLLPFMIFNALGAALIAGLVAGLGFAMGQHAVDVVLTIDQYALWITLSLVGVVVYRSVKKARAEEKAKKALRAEQA